MPFYDIRIELHGTHNYEPLHLAMAKRGMERTIAGNDGQVYELPTGTYCYHGNSSNEQVRSAADDAATECGHTDAAILVGDAKSLSWSGLKVHVKVKKRA